MRHRRLWSQASQLANCFGATFRFSTLCVCVCVCLLHELRVGHARLTVLPSSRWLSMQLDCAVLSALTRSPLCIHNVDITDLRVWFCQLAQYYFYFLLLFFFLFPISFNFFFGLQLSLMQLTVAAVVECEGDSNCVRFSYQFSSAVERCCRAWW